LRPAFSGNLRFKSESDGYSTAHSRCANPSFQTKTLVMRSPWQPIDQTRVAITGGFWDKLQQQVGQVTLGHIYNEMRHQGQLDALRLDQRMHRGREESSSWYWGGSIFWDSDVAKWLEAASAYLQHHRDARLETLVDGTIELLANAQQQDGYLNSHILTWRPRHRFKNLRDLHELYCAGHLIEAAVVHRQATGKETLLNIAIRLADHLAAVFGVGSNQLPGYCGHPEIELALIRLYRLTQEQRYLDLSRFFVEQRGTKPHYFDREAIERLDSTPFRPTHPVSPYAYMQAHLPLREQREVVGHAVRAMYLYSAAADLAYESKDEELGAVCKNLWQDLCQSKLYISGALVQRPRTKDLRKTTICRTFKAMQRRAPRSPCCNGPTAWFISISIANTRTPWREPSTMAFWLDSERMVSRFFITTRSPAMEPITG